MGYEKIMSKTIVSIGKNDWTKKNTPSKNIPFFFKSRNKNKESILLRNRLTIYKLQTTQFGLVIPLFKAIFRLPIPFVKLQN